MFTIFTNLKSKIQTFHTMRLKSTYFLAIRKLFRVMYRHQWNYHFEAAKANFGAATAHLLNNIKKNVFKWLENDWITFKTWQGDSPPPPLSLLCEPPHKGTRLYIFTLRCILLRWRWRFLTVLVVKSQSVQWHFWKIKNCKLKLKSYELTGSLFCWNQIIT